MESLGLLLESYIKHCECNKKLDGKTLKAYRIDLNQFLIFIGNEDIINHKIVEEYVRSLHNIYQPKTVKRKVASVKAFYRYLLREDVVMFDPFSKIEVRFREPQVLPKVIPFGTITKLLKELYCQQSIAGSEYKTRMSVRDAAIIELLFATGMRVSELCSIKRYDIDIDNHFVLIKGKGNKERVIQIENREVLEALTKHFLLFQKEIEQSGYFFINRLGNGISDQSVRTIINHHVSKAAISLHITPHMFRHSFATLLLDADVDIRYIQEILGHSSIKTTEIYTKCSMSKQKEILSVKHPRNRMNIGINTD